MNYNRTGAKKWSYQTADLVSVIAFVVIPVLVFGIPAAAGHPILAGDNLIQNFPLRVLSGRELSNGHLPLWNPYIWSGSPLLAGFNAGALYPLTLLFAFIRPDAAWAFGQIATYSTVAIGLYCLCRHYKLRPIACFLGAFSFAFAGAMSAQSIHIGLIEGTAYLPWGILAILKLSEKCASLERDCSFMSKAFSKIICIEIFGWLSLLAASVGLTILAGEPRAISDNVIVWGLVSLWALFKRGAKRRMMFLVVLLIGIVIALCLGAIQLIPGLEFLHNSQRSLDTYSNFKVGSLPGAWGLLMLVPQLLGGSGSFGQPHFFGSYQAVEVVSYVGILPLVAFCSLAYQGLSSHSRSSRSRSKWSIWYWVAFLGFLLALGGNSAFGQFLWQVPLYGGQRLQSRNLMIVDFALTVIFAFWVDDACTDVRIPEIVIPDLDESLPEEKLRESIIERRQIILRAKEYEAVRRFLASKTHKIVGALPGALGVLLILVAMYWGPGFISLFPALSKHFNISSYRSLIPTLSVQLGICLLGCLIAIGYRKIHLKVRVVIISMFVILDLLVFSATVSFDLSSRAIASAKSLVNQTISTSPQGSQSSQGQGSSVPPPQSSQGQGSSVPPPSSQGPSGPLQQPSFNRIAIYDPEILNKYGLVHLGQPDTNILKDTYSIQGYSSIAPGYYAHATGTHGQATFDSSILNPSVARQIDLNSIYTLSNYLMKPIRNDKTIHSKQSWGISISQTRGWFFGAQLGVQEIEFTNSMPLPSVNSGSSGVKVGLVGPAGDVYWPQSWNVSQAGTGFLSLTTPFQAIGIEIENLSSSATIHVSNLIIYDNGPTNYALQGPLAGYLQPSNWTMVGPAFGYEQFSLKASENSAYILPAAGPGASYRILSGSLDGNVDIETQSLGPVKFVRSVAYQSGWKALLINQANGVESSENIVPDGLVQGLTIPPGHYLIKIVYQPRYLIISEYLSLIGLVVIILMAVGCLLVLGRSRVFEVLPVKVDSLDSPSTSFEGM